MIKLSGSHHLSSITLPQYTFQIKSGEFNKSGEDFTIWFLEGILDNNPRYIDCLMYLGNAYTIQGRHEEGLRVDKKLAELRPEDPIVRYNLACSYSLVGDVDVAIKELEISIKLGYKDIQHIEKDRDLERLRCDKRYWELLDKLKRANMAIRDKEDT